MDIGSEQGFPLANLSNFTFHPFVIDNVQCSSMEGFLQALKFEDIDKQREVCLLVGKEAKFKGKKKKWWRTQTLYWNGNEYKRESRDYQDLLDKAFQALSQNEDFKRALLATESSKLTHSTGKSDMTRTVLTEQEFVDRLTKIRDELNNE